MIEQPIDPPENETKCYVFDCECSCKARVVVYADDLEKAKEYCNIKDSDDFEISNIKVEEIVDWVVEDD